MNDNEIAFTFSASRTPSWQVSPHLALDLPPLSECKTTLLWTKLLMITMAAFVLPR